MSAKTNNNIKLGLFLLGGMLFLVIMLYMIGKNQHLFGTTYLLKARFNNVNGLVSGNNVRVSGIQAGSVKKISFLCDTVIEIDMLIDKDMQAIIRRNAVVSIGTEGLVGNKVVNIVPGPGTAALAAEGDLLKSRYAINTDEVLSTLSRTNTDASSIAAQLKITVERINDSKALWQLMNDEAIPSNVRHAAISIRKTGDNANQLSEQLNGLVADIKAGKGPIGVLLKDSSLTADINAAVFDIRNVASGLDSIVRKTNTMITSIDQQLNNPNGTVHTLLNDSLIAANLRQSISNIQHATDGLNQNMEALKHNFLFRGYFRKLEKQQRRSGQAVKE
jgi:phospholipid/cholesterol/gamma-HCH transport system substrate-binding protein